MVASAPGRSFDWRAHVAIARPDYWFKNVFVIPGIVIALGTVTGVDAKDLAIRIIIGFVATCLIASSNYTLNEVLDAPFDRHHPEKQHRAVPSGRVRPVAAYVQWLLLFVAGLSPKRRARISLPVSKVWRPC